MNQPRLGVPMGNEMMNMNQIYSNQPQIIYHPNIIPINQKIQVESDPFRNKSGSPIVYDPNQYYPPQIPYGWPMPPAIEHRYPLILNNPHPDNHPRQEYQPINNQNRPNEPPRMSNEEGNKFISSTAMYQQPSNPPPNYYYQQQNQQHQQLQNQQKQDPIFWSKKFFTIFQRFQWAYDKFESLRKQYEELCQQLKVVDSQQQWNQLKAHHQEFMEKFIQTHQQMTTVMGQNQQLLEERPQGTDEEAMWQQRYQQLLENYKNLQEQTTTNNNNEDKKENINELAQQYRQLNIQYGKVFNELKENKKRQLKDKQQINQISEKLQYTMEQNGKLKSQLEKMHQELEEMQNILTEHQNQAMTLKRQLISKPKLDKDQYQKFMKIIQDKENQLMQSKRQLNKEKEKHFIIAQQSNKKNQEISELKQIINKYSLEYQSTIPEQYNRIIAIKTDEINQYRKMLKSVEEDFQNRIKQAESNAIKDHIEEIAKLKKQVQSLESSQGQIKIPNSRAADISQKKIANYQQEIVNLNDSINKKGQEITHYKSIVSQIQEARNIKKQFQSIIKERDQLSDALILKDRQLQNFKFQITQIESRLKEFNDKKSDSINRGLIQEINQLKQIIASKDYQIQKNKSINLIREKKINELQGQSDVLRSKIISIEKTFEHERQIMRNQNKGLQTRINDQQRKIRTLQFDFGQSLKNSLQTQISSLRLQNQNKHQIIVKLQNNQIQLKGKISQLQREKKDFQQDIRELKQRSNKQDNSKMQSDRRTQHLTAQIQNRTKIIRTLQMHQDSLKTQLNKFQSQLQECQNTIKMKNQICKQLQMQLQQVQQQSNERAKQRDNIRNQFKYYQQTSEQAIRKLKEQNEEYLELINSGRLQKDLYLANNQNLQQIAILKAENQKLKLQFSKVFDGNLIVKPQPVKASENLSYVQKRLNDFNSKLEQVIEGKQGQNLKSRNKQNSSFMSNIQNKSVDQLKNLKAKFAQLQQYCSVLESRLDGQILPNPNRKLILIEQEKIYSQQIQFYKNQTKQFEERIENLLKMNKQLRNRLDSFLKTTSQSSSVMYYKVQLQQSQKIIENLNQKIQKLADENRNYRAQKSQANSKTLREYQSKQFQYQNQIQQLNRKIRLLEIQKVTNANQRATLIHNISKYESNIEILKASLNEKINMHENVNHDLNMKCVQYENQLSKASMKLKDYQYQNSRINRLLHQLQHQQYIDLTPNQSIITLESIQQADQQFNSHIISLNYAQYKIVNILQFQRCIINQLQFMQFRTIHSKQWNYHVKDNINEYIMRSYSTDMINLQDKIQFYEQQQYLKRYYNISQFWVKIDLLSEYYRFHEQIPKMYIEKVDKIMNQNIDEKRQLQYNKVKRKIKDNTYIPVATTRTLPNNEKILADISLSYQNFQNRQIKNKNQQKLKRVISINCKGSTFLKQPVKKNYAQPKIYTKNIFTQKKIYQQHKNQICISNTSKNIPNIEQNIQKLQYKTSSAENSLTKSKSKVNLINVKVPLNDIPNKYTQKSSRNKLENSNSVKLISHKYNKSQMTKSTKIIRVKSGPKETQQKIKNEDKNQNTSKNKSTMFKKLIKVRQR